MTGSYKYFGVIQHMDSLDIENIGECCLQASTDLGEFYYLWITTSLGQTKIMEYGPDIDGIPPRFLNYNFQQFEYSESRIDKVIAKFVNRPGITQVMEVDYNQILEKIIEPKEFMNNG